MNEATAYDDELREYRYRQAQKEYNFRKTEKERIAEIERKAAAYDAMIEYRDTEKERNGGWTDDELKRMTAFAEGCIQGWDDRPGDELLKDHWVTFADDIDIHFYRSDEQQADLLVFGYRRPIVDGDRKCTNEVRLI